MKTLQYITPAKGRVSYKISSKSRKHLTLSLSVNGYDYDELRVTKDYTGKIYLYGYTTLHDLENFLNNVKNNKYDSITNFCMISLTYYPEDEIFILSFLGSKVIIPCTDTIKMDLNYLLEDLQNYSNYLETQKPTCLQKVSSVLHKITASMR